ncbi:hypothetical protein ACLB2K_030236 [Fragaria x ananassa]
MAKFSEHVILVSKFVQENTHLEKTRLLQKRVRIILTDLVRDPHPPSVPRVRDLQHALNVFDEMLQRRHLPSVVRFTQILTQVSRLKHYSDVISLSKMVQCGIGHNHYSLYLKGLCRLGDT